MQTIIRSKLCLDCKEKNGFVKLMSNKLDRIEEIVSIIIKIFPKEVPENYELVPMEVDNPSDYSIYCSKDFMDLD